MSIIDATSRDPALGAHAAGFRLAVVASDASLAADGALRVTRALATRDGTQLTLLSVVEPTSFPAPVADLTLAAAALPSHDEALLAARRTAIAEQCARTGFDPAVECLVECSVPLSGILFHATRRRADLIVMGLGRHTAVDRLFGTETALHAARESDVATLAVPALATAVPQHALVGTDFDASSLAAARAAARLVGRFGRLTLVHVAQPDEDATDAARSAVRGELDDAFTRAVRTLALPPTMVVDWLAAKGNPAREIVACAAAIGADVIAMGRHSRNLIERLVLGSSTRRVVRTAACSVLVVPREG